MFGANSDVINRASERSSDISFNSNIDGGSEDCAVAAEAHSEPKRLRTMEFRINTIGRTEVKPSLVECQSGTN